MLIFYLTLTRDVFFFRGRTPAEAELMYLENAKKLEMYGVHLQEAKVLTRSCLSDIHNVN